MRIVGFLAGVALLAACSAELPHEAPFDTNAPLEKQAKASLSGTIRLEGETDFSQVTLDLQNESRTYNVDTEADGAVSLTGIVPGEYALKIRTRYFQAVTETLTVELAENVDLGTRTLAPLRGRVLGLATSERVQGTNLVSSGGVQLALRKTASIRSAVSAAPGIRPAADAATAVTLRTVSGIDGSFEFNEVPAGGYTLYAASTETGERAVGSVTVTGEGDLTVDPIVLRPLTGYFEILGMANGVPSSTYTSVAAVNLQLQQSNAVQVKVAVSTDGTAGTCDLSTATPEALPSNTLRPLNLASEGKKLVCVSYIDADGKETEPIYGSITYDATPPTLPSLAINGGAQVVNSNLVTLALSAVDTLAGIANYKVNSANDFGAVSAKPYQPADVFTLTGSDGLKTVWVTFGDHVGNYSAPVSASVVLDTTVPVVNSFSLTRLDGTPLTTGDTIAESRIKLVSSVSESDLEMQLTTNGSFAGQPWVPYDPAKTIDLLSGSSTISVRVRDGAGHVVDVVSAFALSTDTTPPTGMVTIAPTAVTDPAITVQATGSIDAVAVELAFEPGFVTSLGSFVPGPIAVTLPLGDGVKTVYARFFDAAGNASALVGDTVTLDTTPPQILSYTLVQASPTKDNPVTVNYSVAGAAELRITEGGDCGGVREPIGAGTKSFTVSASEGNKEIRLQFFDAAGNASECAVRAIAYDPNPPVVGTMQLNYGQAATSSNVVTVSFAGVSGATKVILSEGAGFAGADWQTYAGAKTFVLSAGNGVKTVYAKVADDAGHVVNVPQATITLDSSTPIAPSIYAAVDVTTQTSVLLTLAAGVVQDMWLTQDDPNFTTGAWEPYSGAKAFTLSGADGVKTIYAKFRKSTGVETVVVSDMVTLDRTAPTLPSVQVNGGTPVVASNVVTLSLSAVDAHSGVAVHKVHEVNDFSAVSPKTYQPTDVYSLPAGDGLKTVWVVYGDKAGNYSAPVSATVTLDTAAPVLNTAIVQTTGGTPLTTGSTIAATRVVLATSVSDLSALQMQVSTTGSFAGAVWEAYNPTKSIDLPAGASTLAARVRDAAGHVSDLIASFSITVDNTPPTSPALAINGKIAGAVSTTTVSVTLSVSADAVDAEIAYDPGFVTSLGSFAPNATHNVPLMAGDGSKSLYVRFFDAAGNTSALAGDTVILDTTPPIASFTIAEATPTKTSPLTLNYTQAGATNLRVAEDAACGGALEAVGSGTKTFAVSASEGLKEVRMQFFDAVGNAGACLVQSVYYDPNPPVVGTLQINYGQAATSGSVVTLSFPGVSGATKVMVSEDAGFTGADWQTFAATKTFVLSPGNGVKTVYAKVADDAGHVVNLTQQSITLDTTPPTSPSIFAAYDVTSQTSVTLFLSAGLVSEMWITQDDPTFTTGAWETYSGSKVFALTGTDGTKTIYAKFKKSTGVETAVVSDTVVLDRTAPILPSLQVNGGAAVVTSNIVTLNLSAVDSASGLYTYKVNDTNDFSALSPKPYQTSDVYALSGGDGEKTVWVTYGDRAGHYSTPVSETVLLDTTPPSIVSATLQLADASAITNGQTVRESRVYLATTVSDLTPLEIQVTTNGSFVGVAWEPYNANKVVDLPLPAGQTAALRNVQARVRDGAGHVANLLNVDLYLDTRGPSGTMTLTSPVLTNNSTISVALSANESPSEAQLSTDPAFAGEDWFATVNTTFTLPAGDGLRTVYARFRDGAGNVSSIVTVSLTIDQTAPMLPQVVVNGGAVLTNNATGEVSLQLSAVDSGSGVTRMKVANLASGDCATALGLAADEAFASPSSWTLDDAGAGKEGSRAVCAALRDGAGNWSAPVSDSITYDTAPPGGFAGSIVIEDGAAYATSTFVQLALAATEATEMMLANGVSFSGSTWEPYGTAANWFLPGSAVEVDRVVSVKFRDAAGNETAPFSDSITLDTRAPASPALSINGGAPYATTTAVTLTLSAVGASGMQISTDGIFDLEPVEPYQTSVSASLLPGDGVKFMYARFLDDAGNASSVAIAYTVLDTKKPSPGTVVINGGAAYTNTPTLQLALSAVDASEMYLSTAGCGMGGAWQDYAASLGYLIGAEGPYTVYAKYRDLAGNETAGCASSAIIYDAALVSPGLAAAVTGPENRTDRTTSQVVAFRWNNVSPDVYEMRIANDAGFSSSNWAPVTAVTTWLLLPGDGLKTVYGQVRDRAGNTSLIFQPQITLDQAGPDTPVISVSDTNLDGYALSSTHVELSWSTPTGTDHFELQRFVAGYDAGFRTITEPTGVQSFADLVTQPGYKHSYRIRSWDEIGNASAWSIVVDAMPYVPVTTAAWARNDGWRHYKLVVNPGIFSLSTQYIYEDSGGTEFTEQWLSNQTTFVRSPLVDRYNERFVMRNANADNSLYYETTIPLGIKMRAVIDPTNAGLYSSLAMDAAGKLHVSYYDLVALDLKYASNVDGPWQAVTVAQTGNVGKHNALGLDTAGKAHISYYDETNGDLMYATNANGTWATYAVDATAANSGTYSSLAVDAAGKVHVAYYDETYLVLKYATNASGSWETAVVDSGGVGKGVKLALDGAGKVHLTYYAEGPTDLKYATNASGAWVKEFAVTSANNVGLTSSLVVDRAGDVHVAYVDTTGTDTRYAKKSGGTWTNTLVDSIGGSDPTIRLAAGMPHILYRAMVNLRYAYFTNGAWVINVIEGTNATGSTGLAISQAGQIHMVHYAGAASGLRYRSQPMVAEQILESGDLGDFGRIAFDANNGVHITYPDQANDRIRYASSASGVWKISTIYSSPSVGGATRTSPAVDGAGKLHVAIGMSAGVQYVTNESGSFTVTPLGTSLASPQLKLDAAGKAHVVYGGAGGVSYVTNRSGNWVTTSVNAPYGSLALDSAGDVFIAYGDTSSKQLKIASYSYGAWTTTVADVWDNNGFPQIAIDGDDRIHVVGFRKYVTNRPGYWTSASLTYGAESFAVSRDGVPFVGTGFSSYATNLLGTWSSQMGAPFTTGYAGPMQYSSIAVDTLGMPHMAIGDEGDGPQLGLHYSAYFSGFLPASAIVLGSPF